MNMTHYMELLATGQPWNLILFMAIPVILAETVAITELGVLFTRRTDGTLRAVNKFASVTVGLYFTVVFVYLLFQVVIPLTAGGGWRGWVDVAAVSFYLLGIVPLLGLALLDMGLLQKGRPEAQRLKIHAYFVGIFLVVTHLAMIFGMLDPYLFSTVPVHMSHPM
ncbi:DUF6803 family protein [Ectobacillus ponti]|uniref:Permease n=1 Tax=Ectobacillus ponti TaxID=2961894 RepID=A0AA41X690_9BACI|nr:DUF6803 family protein [Ectobacillus ponti]MCP8969557.1 permease [Ectobacillus ponti]